MAKTNLDRIRADMERRRKREMRNRRRILLLGFAILCFFLGKFLYDTFAPKPYVPPIPYDVRVANGDNEGLSMVQLLFFRPDPIEDPIRVEAVTDAQGRYRLPEEHWNGDWICQTRDEDGLRSQGFVGKIDPRRGYVEMKALTKIVGKVEDRKGRPLAQARIELRHRMKLGPVLGEALSDEQGRFVFGDISASLKILNFKVRKKGYQIKDIEVEFHPEDGLVLQVGRSRPLILAVVQPDGNPATGLKVSIAGYPFKPRLTDKEGLVRFEGLVPGKSYLPRIHHPTLTYLLPRAIHPSKKTLRVQLAEPLTLEAYAMDRDGHEISELLITHYHGPWHHKESRTDSKGFFRLEGLPPGKARLHYLLPGGEPAELEILMRKGMSKPILKLW